MSHHYIQFSNVCYAYPNGVEALHDVSFRISHGEKVALLGPNGAGKSTLILHTNGLLLPTSGEVNVGDIPVEKKTLPLIRQSVGLVFQNSDDQLFMPTVEEDVAFGPLNMKLPEREVEHRIDMALKAVGCQDLRKRAPSQLSGGQRRRVSIATVLSMEPSVLVLDEPSSNLDWKSREDLIRIISSFTHTCLIASHDVDLVKRVCQRSIVLKDGRIIADRPTDEIFTDQDLMRELGLIS
ncbi:MAG: energy-coupling factor ABC transporter ATP-binding protein [Muribaculaceae bacterium]|nr:energy-coupling factor ABC transporter ATP-binding protein [Muribaculaceae bacterium]